MKIRNLWNRLVALRDSSATFLLKSSLDRLRSLMSHSPQKDHKYTLANYPVFQDHLSRLEQILILITATACWPRAWTRCCPMIWKPVSHSYRTTSMQRLDLRVCLMPLANLQKASCACWVQMEILQPKNCLVWSVSCKRKKACLFKRKPVKLT